MIDCLIVGGGPAGLTAGIYTARFRLSTLVVDAGASRARMIPRTHNHAGFPTGIAGAELVDRMGEQARRYGVEIARRNVIDLQRQGETFRARTASGAIEARAVLLATGVINRHPPMDQALHDAALEQGALRYCPVCDGFEALDQDIAVIGTGEHAVREAQFLRGFSRRVSAIPVAGDQGFDAAGLAALAEAGVQAFPGPGRVLGLEAGGLVLETGEGPRRFDTVYPAMGSQVRSELARTAGARTSGEDCVIVDAHQRTSVPGLYAAGDVVIGLDQISHAMGQAGVAATTIRNDLDARAPLRR